VFVALLRRVVAFIPCVGDDAPWLPIRYHFDFVHGGQVVGRHQRRTGLFTFRGVYGKDLSAEPERRLDRRLVLANAVGMDRFRRADGRRQLARSRPGSCACARSDSRSSAVSSSAATPLRM